MHTLAALSQAVNTVSSSVELISPEIAQRLLTGMHPNRAVSKSTVEFYANQMRDGQWTLSGEPIIVSADERMMDGQHRCIAVIESGARVPMLVVRGVNYAESFPVIDTGSVRTASDILSIRSIKHPNTTAAAARLLHYHELGNLGLSNAGSKRAKLPNRVIEDVVARNPALALSVQFCRESGLPWNTGLFAFCHYVFGQKDPAARDQFFDQLITGEGLVKTQPAYWLRERLLRDIGVRGSKINALARLAYTIKAWNVFLRRGTMGILRWKPNENFPEIAQ